MFADDEEKTSNAAMLTSDSIGAKAFHAKSAKSEV
jgi:hypothetical protein